MVQTRTAKKSLNLTLRAVKHTDESLEMFSKIYWHAISTPP